MNQDVIKNEIEYRFSTSSGSGGQHVNRVQTKVRACFHLDTSNGLSQEEKLRLTKVIDQKLDEKGFFCVTSQSTRSQVKNKKDATEKLLNFLEQALVEPKKRKKTKIPPVVKEKIREEKSRRSKIKNTRKKVNVWKINSLD